MKQIHISSAIPIYIAAAVWLIVGMLFPRLLLGIPGLLATALLSTGAAVFSRRFFPGRDEEVEEKITTGDAALDAEIARGRARLEALRSANAAIVHPEITRNLNRMVTAGEHIFRELGREPKKAALVRRFMSYYLPTAEKLMNTYQVLMQASTGGENVQASMRRIEESSSLIADAFEKCGDNLFASEELDIDAEIKALKTMLAGDNLLSDATSSTTEAREDHPAVMGGQSQ